MKTRVAAQLSRERARGLTVSTFHTFGLRLLREEVARAGLRRGFTILDELDVEQLLGELAKREDLDRSAVQSARHRLSGWKNTLVDPATALAKAESDDDTFHAALYDAYERALRAYNAVDFDDLILLPVRLLRESPELLERWQNRVRHLLVDEYQDTNHAQYELVRRLVGVRGALTVVGDDDQSIYAWRGARPENLARLRDDFPGLKLIKLEQNYRSSGRILHAANALIAQNAHVFEKRLWSEHGPGELLRVLSCRDEEDEAERVVSEIVHRRFSTGAPYRAFAILYRGNHQSRPIEKALRTQGVPYFLSGGSSFFSRTEVKDVTAYLRLLANPDDDAAFLRVVNTPRREIGPNTLEKLARYAAQREQPLLAAIHELGLDEVLPARTCRRLREFAVWRTSLARLCETTGTTRGLRQLLNDIDYRHWLETTSSSDTAGDRRWATVEELLGWIERLEGSDSMEIGDLVSRLALLDILERQDEEDDNDRVALMTLHAAKGLEFPQVFLVGMEEDLLPHHSSSEESAIAEERRLAYVGLTRAQRQLTMTYAKRRRRGGENVRCAPSRFLAELPADDLHWEGRGQDLTPEEREARGKASIAGLKALLGSD
jgi:ATP-dependent DNA helicase Rep